MNCCRRFHYRYADQLCGHPFIRHLCDCESHSNVNQQLDSLCSCWRAVCQICIRLAFIQPKRLTLRDKIWHRVIRSFKFIPEVLDGQVLPQSTGNFFIDLNLCIGTLSYLKRKESPSFSTK